LKESLKEPARIPSENQALAALMIYEEKIIEYISAMDDAIQNTQKDTFHLKLEPQLTTLAQTTATAFSRLAEAMTDRRHQIQLLELNSAVIAVDGQLFALRKEGVSQSHPLDEIMRFYSFVYSMKETVKYLQNMATTAAGLH
jgi:hypothetical protein